jgi:hypothetical protein
MSSAVWSQNASVLINKTLSDFNFCNTVKHENTQFLAKVRGKREGDGKRYGGRRERGSRDR